MNMYEICKYVLVRCASWRRRLRRWRRGGSTATSSRRALRHRPLAPASLLHCWALLLRLIHCVIKQCTLLQELMNKKEVVGDLFNNLRLARQRSVQSAAAAPAALASAHSSSGSGNGSAAAARDAAALDLEDQESINSTLAQLLMIMERLDAQIGARLIWHHPRPPETVPDLPQLPAGHS